MGSLNQEVSQLTKDLHHIMHLLQAQVAVHHYTASLSSYPYGVHMMSNPNASTSVAYSMGPSMHLHQDTHGLHHQVDHTVSENISHLGSSIWNHSGAHGTESKPQCNFLLFSHQM